MLTVDTSQRISVSGSVFLRGMPRLIDYRLDTRHSRSSLVHTGHPRDFVCSCPYCRRTGPAYPINSTH
jgi:hypothetical protein